MRHQIAVSQVAFINRKDAADARLIIMNATCWQPVFQVIKGAAKEHETAAATAFTLAMATCRALSHVIHAHKADVGAAQLPPHENG